MNYKIPNDLSIKSVSFKCLSIICVFISLSCKSQEAKNNYEYVNPFIGTGKSPIAANWDGNGGTYPGAVAPFGFIQLSPETGFGYAKGYDYAKDSISFFSCIEHKSGYPHGSAGKLFVMPIKNFNLNFANKIGRPYSHSKENATPGYYSVVLNDDNTLIEATATQRTGMFRFTFKKAVKPIIFIGGIGNVEIIKNNTLSGSMRNSVIEFNKSFTEIIKVKGGTLLSFPYQNQGETTILLKLSTSSVGLQSALRNIEVENNGWDFDRVKEKTMKKWSDVLSVIEIADESESNKTIFYTALYHSMLIPWVISDVQGAYKGPDGKLAITKGINEYGMFSPWDTFRSLHPLLCLLAPEIQNDMILSMLDVYQQSGWLPTAPMTGNHAIPIIVDSYFKGITNFDISLAYEAMKKSLLGPKYYHKDMGLYDSIGYIPFTKSNSVTKTVEYAYDDWVLAQFSKLVLNKEADYAYLLNRSFNYRNLFHPGELFLLPRNKDDFKITPGNFGYKEGDKWIYSYAIQHNPQDIINLFGGNDAFVNRLDMAFSNNHVVFDNEPAFHIPYLFVYAGQPYKTQKWLNHIRLRFTPEPGGLPGNDDLGSMSSSYIFNAMGFYPVSPGKSIYTIGAPMFSKLTMHLAGNKKFIVKANNVSLKNYYIRKVFLNGIEFNKSWISHSTIMKGGEITFDMDSIPNYSWATDKLAIPESETKGIPEFQIDKMVISKKKVFPNEKFWVKFSVSNRGNLGTKNVQLYVDGKEYANKNIVLNENIHKWDSLECRLFNIGEALLSIKGITKTSKVLVTDNELDDQFTYEQLSLSPMVKLGETQELSLRVKNIGGKKDTSYIKIVLNEAIIHTEHMVLLPGEERTYKHSYIPTEKGLYTISINNLKSKYKVFATAMEAIFVDLSLQETFIKDKILDKSGLLNNGYIRYKRPNVSRKRNNFSFGENAYVEIVGEHSNLELSKITIMAWVRPSKENKNLIALITKGDNTVIQTHGNSSLNFFVGGWGRGECAVDLPKNWAEQWHHLAGVCDGENLMIYIDGKLENSISLGSSALPNSPSRWNLGRNYEFPGERIYKGKIDKVKIFVEPLTKSEIHKIIKAEKKAFLN